MANGAEDLAEKNKDKEAELKKGQYTAWTNFQGREDAEMLYEKRDNWMKAKNAREYYANRDRDDY